MRPAMTPWFEHYASKSWVFTALKFQGKKEKTPTKALCISFKADEPFYPFKMPSDTYAEDTYRPIDLYVLSQSEMDASLTGGSAWRGERMWTKALEKPAVAYWKSRFLADGSDLEMPATLSLTRFRNVPEANVYSQDIVFRPSRSYTLVWTGAGVAAVALLVWRRHTKRTGKAPPPGS
ncbi:MAG: hypothetical protein K1X67_19880 [Fimbriimonadaceae bacterium]|nr:hypothetical protein [Fimbriimonadaceae bacterium]